MGHSLPQSFGSARPHSLWGPNAKSGTNDERRQKLVQHEKPQGTCQGGCVEAKVDTHLKRKLKKHT